MDLLFSVTQPPCFDEAAVGVTETSGKYFESSTRGRDGLRGTARPAVELSFLKRPHLPAVIAAVILPTASALTSMFQCPSYTAAQFIASRTNCSVS